MAFAGWGVFKWTLVLGVVVGFGYGVELISDLPRWHRFEG
jgi:hypothetical protein